MKTIYILLILLLSFSFANAQDNVEAIKMDANVLFSGNNEDVTLNVNNSKTAPTVKEDITTEATIARNSDIKIYLNHLRNVENIELLFPKLNKTVKA